MLSLPLSNAHTLPIQFGSQWILSLGELQRRRTTALLFFSCI